MSLRIGIIGAGAKAADHARYFAQCSRTKVVAIHDPDVIKGDALAREVGARAVADYRSVIDDADAVIVASPNWLHVEHAVAAARSGRHLFCEKPMGLSLVEAKQIQSAVRNARVVSTIGFSVSFTPLVQTILRLHDTGELGELASVFSRRLFYMDPHTSPAWRLDPRKSGGLLFEINIHELEWMIRLGGRVKAVSARTRSVASDHPRANDHLWATLDFDRGAVGTHEGSWASAATNFYRGAYGSLGSVTSDEWGSQLHRCRNGGNRETLPLDAALDLRRNFLDAIDGTAVSVADADWGTSVTAVAEAVLESAATGQTVTMPAAANQRENVSCESLITR